MTSTISLCLEPMHPTQAKHFFFKMLSSSPEVQKDFLNQKVSVKVCPILKQREHFHVISFQVK